MKNCRTTLLVAGYYVTNKSKTDYNFIPSSQLYHGKEWNKARPDQPIFARFQISGGKRRSAATHVDLDGIELPPYYADHPVIRSDWASYLESWVLTDHDVAKILANLGSRPNTNAPHDGAGRFVRFTKPTDQTFIGSGILKPMRLVSFNRAFAASA